MPISFRYRLIYIHIPKTGGTSIEKALWMRGPFNFQSSRGRLRYLYGIKDNIALHHLTAQEVIKRMPEKCREYEMFTVVRNPFDRIVSEYCWRKLEGQMTLEDFLERKVSVNLLEQDDRPLDVHYQPQTDFIVDGDDNIMVPNVLRFERFEEELENFLTPRGIHVKMPHRNQTHHTHYQTYFNARSKTMVESLYAKDLELLRYSF